MPSPSRKRQRVLPPELRQHLAPLGCHGSEYRDRSSGVFGCRRCGVPIKPNESISSIHLLIPSDDISISLEIDICSGPTIVDITQGLSSHWISELADHVRCEAIQLLYMCQLSSDGMEVVIYSSIEFSFFRGRKYSFDCLRWCLGDKTPPWMELYSSIPRGVHREPFDSKHLAAQLLEDISSNRDDLNYSSAEVEAVEKELRRLGLLTQLRRYQLKGVLWLRSRMRFELETNPPSARENGSVDGFMPLEEELTQQKFWYSILTGEVAACRPNRMLVAGGILGDFMGLGKSIQILALILLSVDRSMPAIDEAFLTNTQDKSVSTISNLSDDAVCVCGHRSLHYCEDFVACRTCSKRRHSACMLESSSVCFDCTCATLSASPPPVATSLLILPRGLISQWLAEIKKHMPSSDDSECLRVFVYEGVIRSMRSAKTDASAATRVDPRVLSSYDLVIVALDTLREEVYLQASDSFAPVTRKARLYSRPISPLLCLNWNILIVDETQKIESEGNASKMSMRLVARHRFVVSGTPMGHSQIDDLHYLLKFLRVAPYDCFENWKILISSILPISPKIGLERLLRLLRPLMIRRRKEDVADEFESTPQTFDVRMLQFSSFEHMEYDTNEATALAAVRCTPRNSLKKMQLAIDKIENLRKSCCHPQAFMKSGRHNPLTYDDIIITRIEKLSAELEESQRKFLYNMTSLAGCVQLLQNASGEFIIDNFFAAAQIYALALRTVDRNRQICDLLGIGLITEDDNLLLIESRSVRLDSMHFIWSIDDLRTCQSGMDSSLDHVARSLRCGSRFNINRVVYFHEIHLSRLPNLSMSLERQLYAKVEFSSGKRLNEIVFSSSIAEFISNLQPGILAAILFPADVRISTSSISRSFEVEIPCPIRLSADGRWASIVEEELIIANFQPMRLKSIAVNPRSFHENCLLLLKHSAEETSAAIVEFKNLGQLSSKMETPLKVFVDLRIKLRGAAFDCDVFQELHIRENLVHCLSTLLLKHGIDTLPEVSALTEVNWSEKVIFTEETIQSGSTTMASVVTSPTRVAPTPIKSPAKEQDECRELKCERVIENEREIARSLKEGYVLRSLNRRQACSADLKRVIEKVEEKRRALSDESKYWWVLFLEPLVNSNGEGYDRVSSALIREIKDVVNRGQLAYLSLANVRSSKKLLDTIHALYTSLFKARKSILKSFQDLSDTPSKSEISETSNCKMCCESHGKTGPVCSHCHLQGRLFEYAQMLFAYKRRVKRLKQIREDMRNTLDDKIFEEQEVKEYEVDGVVVMILRELRKFVHSSVHQSILTIYDPRSLNIIKEAAKVEDDAFSFMQQELRTLNSLWISHQMLLFAYDDLEQAVSRIRLLDTQHFPHISSTIRNGFVTIGELSERCMTDYSIAIESGMDLEKLTSRMRYMRYEESRMRDDADKECVICQCPLDSDVRMLPCLHSFHDQCIVRWLASKRKCPLCQAKTSQRDLIPVENDLVRRGSQPVVKLCSDFGTKINVLIGDLLKLIREGDEKAIVFSQWPEMLHIIGKALDKNFIRHSACFSNKDLSTCSNRVAPLDKFRYDINIRVLLIPLSLGSDGLSITEASHIFLLEPLLNKTVEDQAVARISRIGQVRPTFVHKYVLLKTIEERIHMNQVNGDKMKSNVDRSLSEKKTLTIEVLNRLFE